MELLEVLRVFPAGHGHELLPVVEVARQERALRPLGRRLDGAGHARPGVAELLLLAGFDLVAVKDSNHAGNLLGTASELHLASPPARLAALMPPPGPSV